MSESSRYSTLLELNVVFDQIRERALSSEGLAWIDNLSTFTDAELLRIELTRVSEMRALLDFDDPFPLTRFGEFRNELERAEVQGATMSPEALVRLGDFLAMVRRVKGYFKDRPEKYARLARIAGDLTPLKELESEIGRIFEPSGDVKDKASAELARIRRERRRKESQARSRLDSLMRKMTDAGAAQGDVLVIREGRPVIPVKDSHRGKIKGVIVDTSAGGATVFIEPFEVLEINNAVRRLLIQEQREIDRILAELTGKVGAELSAITGNLDAAGQLDCLRARGLFSQTLNGHAAEVAEAGTFELKNARHPLLLLREARENVVPLTLKMGGQRKTLVVTGPNAGGKTVALKTVGLLGLMQMHGLHVPADEGSEIPLWSRVFADIGDRQSIEQDLSTFSSHIQSLRQIVLESDARSLILLDEIGSSTDPAEGAALAEVILRTLTQRGCLTIATTHMGSLKVFANEEPGVENGSMIFDQETLRPTYRFQAGIPGSSYAFEIAQRFGFPSDLIAQARELVGEDRGKLDRLILQLEHSVERAHALQAEAEIKESRLSGMTKLYEDRLARLKTEGEAQKQKILEEAEEILRQANAESERLVREIRESQARRETIQASKQRLDEQKKRIKTVKKRAVRAEPEPSGPVVNGDWVKWKGHGGLARVISEPDSKGRVRIEMKGMKLQVPLKDLSRARGPNPKESPPVVAKIKADTRVRDEVDLRGMTADEALEAVSRYLSNAVVSGYGQVRIIHGKGTGVLRKEIGQFLSGSRMVRSHRLGNWNEGDTGVTIVELK